MAAFIALIIICVIYNKMREFVGKTGDALVAAKRRLDK